MKLTKLVLRAIGRQCHMGPQCYLPPDTCETRLNPSQTGRYSIYLPRKDGRLSCPIAHMTSCITESRYQ